MTIEEAITAIKTWEGCMRRANKDNEFAMEFIEGAVALYKEVQRSMEDEKYRWHDLRKNPEDLPKDRNVKLTIVIGKENYIRYEVLKYNDHKLPFEDNPIGWSRNDEYGCDVIAWRDLELFEEEDKLQTQNIAEELRKAVKELGRM